MENYRYQGIEFWYFYSSFVASTGKIMRSNICLQRNVLWKNICVISYQIRRMKLKL